MSFIITRSGRKIDVMNPRPSDMILEDIAFNLAHIPRFTGNVGAYSVAQHSIHVMEIVMGMESCGDRIELQALFHDAAEAFVGDLATPIKALCPDYRKVESRFHKAIAKQFNIPIKTSKSVKYADLVMLATERRDLLPFCVDEFECLKGISPRPEKIVIRSSTDVFTSFLLLSKMFGRGINGKR